MTVKKINQGVLVWITGLPGSGKTMLAKKVYEEVKNLYPSVRMDGDVFREIMGNDLGYTTVDRKANAFRLARMNKYLVEHGLVVICATVSLFSEVHKWNRKNIKKVIEVFVEVPHHILRKRDQKKMYSRAKSGQMNNVYGVDQTYDLPAKPEIVIKNDGSLKDFLANSKKIRKLISDIL